MKWPVAATKNVALSEGALHETPHGKVICFAQVIVKCSLEKVPNLQIAE